MGEALGAPGQDSPEAASVAERMQRRKTGERLLRTTLQLVKDWLHTEILAGNLEWSDEAALVRFVEKKMHDYLEQRLSGPLLHLPG